MKKFIKKNKWNLLLVSIVLIFFCSLFAVETVENSVNKNNLEVWQNIFIGFIACDVTIISIFFGAFIPLLVGNVKENIPAKYSEVIKKKFLDIKKFGVVILMLTIHFLQLMGCIYSFYYEPVVIFFTIITGLYFFWIFLTGYQIYSGFNYASYFSKQIDKLFKMIQNDILKKKISERKKIKYGKKLGFIIDGFPENKEQINELGNLKLTIGIKIYYFAINIFSNGLFLYDRFGFFKWNINTMNLTYLKDDDGDFNHEINLMENILMKKLSDFYSWCNNNEVNSIFSQIQDNNNINSFGNLSYSGMSFLTKLHLKISIMKNWKIDITWLIFLSKFVNQNKELVMIESKDELECYNNKSAKKFVIKNIYVNPRLFSYYRRICNDKKVLKKSFTFGAFQFLYTYAAMQSLFAIGKFTMENEKDILTMLSLVNYQNQKFIFNGYIKESTDGLDELIKYVSNNEKIKKENKMYWVEKLKKNLEIAEIKIVKQDIKDIQLKKYDTTSDFLVEEVTLEILNSQELLNASILNDWTTKLYDYVLKEIKEKKKELQLNNFSKYYQISFPRPLLKLLANSLRVQLAFYPLDSKAYKNAVNTILDMKKYNFLITFDYFEDKLAKFINKKFNLIKEKQSPYKFYENKWFNLKFLNTEKEIRKEKEEWVNMKKLK